MAGSSLEWCQKRGTYSREALEGKEASLRENEGINKTCRHKKKGKMT